MLMLFLLSLAAPAIAVDGVVEINQTCALQTGCVPGDTPGFPITLGATGSYRLTSNLTGLGANTDGFVLNNSRITIDFNGFSLAGPAVGSGTGHGIGGGGTNGSFAGFATIRNGVIRGTRGKAIALAGARGVRVEGMAIHFNAGGGIQVGEEGQVSSNRVAQNGSPAGSGITAGDRSSILDNVVSDSGPDNIVCYGGCAISNNTSSGAAGNGISVPNAAGSTISGNTARENGGWGIAAGEGATITGNTTYQNTGGGIQAQRGSTLSDNTAYFNVGAGISAANDSIVQGNSVSRNLAGGLSLGATTTYRNNTMNQNTGGAEVSGGVDMGGNSCDGGTSCP